MSTESSSTSRFVAVKPAIAWFGLGLVAGLLPIGPLVVFPVLVIAAVTSGRRRRWLPVLFTVAGVCVALAVQITVSSVRSTDHPKPTSGCFFSSRC